MKKWCFILVVTLLFSLSACGNQPNNTTTEPQPTMDHSEPTNAHQVNANQAKGGSGSKEYLDSSLFPVLEEEGPNYQLYSSNMLGGYYYKIFDNHGDLIEDGFLTWRFLSIEMLDENILAVSTNAGMSLSSVKVYDVENRRVSAVLPSILGVSGDLYAYFTTDDQGIKLVVQDIFDAREYYYEIPDRCFTTDVYLVTTCTAEFDNENKNITVTYPTETGEMVSKTFPLQ